MGLKIDLHRHRIGTNSNLRYSAQHLLRQNKLEIKVYAGYSIIVVWGGSRGTGRPKIRTERVRNTDTVRVARSLANKFKIDRKNIEVLYEDSTENKES